MRNFTHNFQVSLFVFEKLYMGSWVLPANELCYIAGCNLYAAGSGYHALIGEAFRYFFDPIVKPRNKCIVKLESRQQCLLEFEIELHKL